MTDLLSPLLCVICTLFLHCRYAQLSAAAIKEHISELDYLDAVCNASPVNYAACFESTILRVAFAIVIMILIALSIVLVSFFLEKSNRRAFVSKKVVSVQKQKLQKNTKESKFAPSQTQRPPVPLSPSPLET